MPPKSKSGKTKEKKPIAKKKQGPQKGKAAQAKAGKSKSKVPAPKKQARRQSSKNDKKAPVKRAPVGSSKKKSSAKRASSSSKSTSKKKILTKKGAATAASKKKDATGVAEVVPSDEEEEGEREIDMSDYEGETGIIFLPSLDEVLIQAEDMMNRPLTIEEAMKIRDGATTMVVPLDYAEKVNAESGFTDLEPENLWYQWQMLRRHLSREPELDPGPNIGEVKTSTEKYQHQSANARNSLDQFQNLLLRSPPQDIHTALLKVLIQDGDRKAGETGGLVWLGNPSPCLTSTSATKTKKKKAATDRINKRKEKGYNSSKDKEDEEEEEGPIMMWCGEIIEEVPHLAQHPEGTKVTVRLDQIHDWMVIDSTGTLFGGASMRAARAKLPNDEAKQQWDMNYGITAFAPLAGEGDNAAE